MKCAKAGVLFVAGILTGGVLTASAATVDLGGDSAGLLVSERGWTGLTTRGSGFTANDGGLRISAPSSGGPTNMLIDAKSFNVLRQWDPSTEGYPTNFCGTGNFTYYTSTSTVTPYRHLYFSAGEGHALDTETATAGTFTSASGAGWYRIAICKSNGNWGNLETWSRADAVFTIRADGGNGIQLIRITAGMMFSDMTNASLRLQSQSWYGWSSTVRPFTQVRIVPTADYYGSALEVYFAYPTFATFSILDNISYTGWEPVKWEKQTTNPSSSTVIRLLKLEDTTTHESKASAESVLVQYQDSSTATNVFSVTSNGKVLVKPQGGLSMGSFSAGSKP